jgi:hypothetical protein
MTEHQSTDRAQQIVVTASYVICLVGSMIGVGVLGGTPIASAAGGALAADATLLAPASPAFSVWTVVYLGLAGYTVLQWFPRAASPGRQRRLRLPVAGTMLLNAAWILVVQAGWLWASVAVIAVLLALLSRVFMILVRTRAAGMPERVLVDGSLGLYLGWVCVATAANIAAALTGSGFDGAGIDPDGWAVAVLVAVGCVGVALAVRSGGRVAVAAAIAWGLAWIAVARWDGMPQSVPTAATAAAAAVAVLAVTAVLRLRGVRQEPARVIP